MGVTEASQQRRWTGQAPGRGTVEATTKALKTARSNTGTEEIVTLLATVVFGLGWAIVELERADPMIDRYLGEQWTELALQRWNR